MGILVQRHRIEVWEDVTNAARADRIFDEQNHLLAERLQNKNSGPVLFHHRKIESMPISVEDIFELQPSVRTFETLVGNAPILTMEQRSGLYVITYPGKSVTPMGQLLKATLTLSALDLHVIEQTLVIESGGQILEYRFVEVSFESVARQEVESKVFESTAEAKPSPAGSPVSVDHNSVTSLTRRSAIPSAELEIEATYLLDKAKGDRNEQIKLSRDKNGSLRIDGVVETKVRKDELLHALGPVIHNPSVSVNIQTVDTVATKDLGKNMLWSTQSSDIVADRIAVDRELREYLSTTRSGPSHGNDIDSDVNAFASQTVNRSYRAVFHAVELKDLADRFSNTNMRSISAEAQDKLHEMIRTHAKGFMREYAILRRDIEAVSHFQHSADILKEQPIDNDVQLITAIQKLCRLAQANNETIRAAFTISGQRLNVGLNSERFWKDLIDAQQMAGAIEKY
jgi:hypothetical protein